MMRDVMGISGCSVMRDLCVRVYACVVCGVMYAVRRVVLNERFEVT